MPKLKAAIREERIVYQVRLDLKDIRKHEKDYDKIISSITKKLSSDGELDKAQFARLVSDCREILSRVKDARSLLPLKLLAFFEEIIEYLGHMDLRNVGDEEEKRLIAECRHQVEKLKESGRHMTLKNRRRAADEKAYSGLLRRLASDYKLFGKEEILNISEEKYGEIIDDMYAKDYEAKNNKRLLAAIEGMVQAFEEELDIISIEEARKLYELNRLENALRTMKQIGHDDTTAWALDEIIKLKKIFSIELSQPLLFDQRLSEIEWKLLHLETESRGKKPKLGLHSTNKILVQYAIASGFMYGCPGGRVFVSVDERFLPKYERRETLKEIADKLEEIGFKPMDKTMVLEFDLGRIRTLRPADHDDAIKAVKLMGMGEFPEKYPWYSFDCPVKLTDCLTRRSLKEVLQLRKEMGYARS